MMNRRKFIQTSSSLTAGLTAGFGLVSCSRSSSSAILELDKTRKRYSSFRGFNLLEKFGTWNGRQKFREKDFEILAEWGMNFARIPMSYWNWSKKENWFEIDEGVLKDIDEVVELGSQYRVHINLNLHRIPGYCINGREEEPCDLFEDTEENMQRALNGAMYHWRLFADRYKGIPSSQLSFDLINEPPFMTDPSRYVEVVRALVGVIREIDPYRLIVVDGKDVGRNPVPGIADLNVPQSTRGYDPMCVSHYQASWPPKSAFETLNEPTWPIEDDSGQTWNKAYLRERLIKPWLPMVENGVQVHVGEWGCYNKTPHDVALAWMRDLLSLWKEMNWGHAMWNLRGDFGPLDSKRSDVVYENYKGHKLDRKMLELLREFNT